MKLQSLGIVFAMIILPIVIVLSYYISLQVDTIALQTSYDSSLMNATYDALSALEINTANEDLSSVSDSLRSIIEASNSIFFNTLSTNFGVSNASNSYMKAYIPAILYTLYDGYYIYSPTKQPKICTYGDADSANWLNEGNVWKTDGTGTFTMPTDTSKDGQPIYVVPRSEGGYYVSETGELLYKQTDGSYSTSLDNAEYTTSYILKSYMPYSARYKHGSIDVTINYTLDNYLNIEGTVGNVYYTKTGYLIDPNLVTKIEVDGTDKTTDLIGKFNGSSVNCSYTAGYVGYNEDEAENYCLSGEHEIKVTLKDSLQNVETTIIANRIEDPDNSGSYLSESEAKEKLAKLYDDYQSAYYSEVINDSGENTVTTLNTKIQYLENELQNMRAVAYYVSSTCFSRWVYVNLNAIEEKDIQMDAMNNDQSTYSTTLNTGIYADFSGSSTRIFNCTQNPEDGEISSFMNHKSSVIRNSIQYNLNLAFSVYTDMSQGKLTFETPIMTDDEWAKIESRISVVAFMQGIPCGTKTYSNYSLVSSTNNEMTVIPEEIYYVPKDNFNDEKTETHRIDCSDLGETSDSGDPLDYIAYTSKELKYDKIYNKSTGVYEYDHKNLSCYNCIINKNYEKLVLNADGTTTKSYSDTININALSDNKVRAYYTAVGALRQNLYKTNALTASEGYVGQQINSGSMDINNNTIGARASSNEHNNITLTLDRKINEVKRIQIVIYGLSTNDINETTVKFHVKIGKTETKEIGTQTLSTAYYSNLDSLHPEYVKYQTIELDVDPGLFNGCDDSTTTIILERDDGSNKSSTLLFATTYVRVIYR
jgi:hypothetical protein